MSSSQSASNWEKSSSMALLEAVVNRRDRNALNELVGRRPVCVLANGRRVTIGEYIIARCMGHEGPPLPRSADRDLVCDLLFDRFYTLLPDEVAS